MLPLTQLAAQVGEGPGVVLDLLGELVGAGPGDADGLVGKGALVGERRDPARHVLILGDLVSPPHDLLVVQFHFDLQNYLSA
jgi:hypothetical protein